MTYYLTTSAWPWDESSVSAGDPVCAYCGRMYYPLHANQCDGCGAPRRITKPSTRDKGAALTDRIDDETGRPISAREWAAGGYVEVTTFGSAERRYLLTRRGV